MTDKERAAIYEKMQQDIAKASNRVEHFWQHSYPLLSEQAKLQVWSKYLFSLLRWNGESVDEQLDMFTKESYETWKKREPQIDKLLEALIPKVSEYLGGGYERLIRDRLNR
ncbi:MAG: hypothetical protein AAGF77_14735 [Bacteroidota bacterium]